MATQVPVSGRQHTQSEQAAPQGCPLFHALMAALPDAVVLVDAAGQVTHWNGQAARIFGWSGAEIQGHRLTEVIFPTLGEIPSLADLAEKYARDATTDAWPRLIARRRDGDHFTAAVRVVKAAIDGQDGHIVVVRDMADALLAEQQLIQAQKLEALGHLTGGLAHDFNNILGIIIGSLDLVVPDITGSEERELLNASLAAARRGAEITRSLLAVARRRAIKPQRTDISELIADLAPLLIQTAGKNIEVMFSANALDPFCMIDPGGLNNALVNLVINARDAMPSGGRLLVYAYSTDILPKSLVAPLELKVGTYLVIGVDDDGMGMPPEIAMRAFDPFFTTKERGQGTGLGLAMVYGFARQSGGTARIQSAPGNGTSVQLFIPTIPATVD